MVATAEGAANLFVALAGQFACKVNGNGSGCDDRLTPGSAFELCLRQAEISGGYGQNLPQFGLPREASGYESIGVGRCTLRRIRRCRTKLE